MYNIMILQAIMFENQKLLELSHTMSEVSYYNNNVIMLKISPPGATAHEVKSLVFTIQPLVMGVE